MKTFGKTLIFILSTILRTLSLLIFILTHLAWGIYSYQIDPIRLLDLGTIPAMMGDFLWLYIGLGVLILVFLTLGFKFMAYFTFVGAWLGQNIYFMRKWDNLIYNANEASFLNQWYGMIFISLLLGFLLQVLYTGGTKYYKISKYNRLRQKSQKMKNI